MKRPITIKKRALFGASFVFMIGVSLIAKAGSIYQSASKYCDFDGRQINCPQYRKTSTDIGDAYSAKESLENVDVTKLVVFKPTTGKGDSPRVTELTQYSEKAGAQDGKKSRPESVLEKQANNDFFQIETSKFQDERLISRTHCLGRQRSWKNHQFFCATATKSICEQLRKTYFRNLASMSMTKEDFNKKRKECHDITKTYHQLFIESAAAQTSRIQPHYEAYAEQDMKAAEETYKRQIGQSGMGSMFQNKFVSATNVGNTDEITQTLADSMDLNQVMARTLDSCLENQFDLKQASGTQTKTQTTQGSKL